MHERRQRRSNDQLQALRHYLSACCQRAELDGMVLADSEGISVAAAGNHDACEEAAAAMAVLGRRMQNYEGALQVPGGSVHMRGRRVQLDDSHVYICAVGGGGETRGAEIQRSIADVRRILEQACGLQP